MFPKFSEYVNVNHACPFEPGIYYLKIKNVSLDVIDVPQIVPAGRYRLEVKIHGGCKGPMLLTRKFYFNVCDHRVEVF